MAMDAIPVCCLVVMILIPATDGACMVGRKDIAFVIDESGSVGSVNFAKQLTFLQKVAASFAVGPEATLFGAVTFNTAARLAFTFDQHTTQSELQSAISSVSYVPGGTSIGAGIDFARQHLFAATNGDRPDVDDYIIVITDGYSMDTVTSGVAARMAGFTLFAVGVDGYDANDLAGATGDINNVFTAVNYDLLDPLVNQLADAFPCDYFCGDLAIGYGDFGDQTTNTDADVGQTFLMTDDIYAVSCCGVVRSVEVVPSVAGTMSFLVWRRNDSELESQIYWLVGRSDVTMTDSQIGTVVNVTFPVGNRIAIIEGDIFGWYSAGIVMPSYAPCLDTTCPSSYHTVTASSPELGTSLDWSGSGVSTVSGRVYGVRVHTSNNSAPASPTVISTIIPDHLAIGDVVFTYVPVDPDVAETFAHSLNHTYFGINSVTGDVTIKSVLPRSYAQYLVPVESTDSCHHTLTATLTITTYNAPPVVENLPAIVVIIDNVTTGEVIYNLAVVDQSNDSLCCSISRVNPPSSNFILNTSDHDIRVVVSEQAEFDNRRISNHYRLTLCCADGIITTQNYLEVKVKSAKRASQYVPPDWFSAAVTLSMVPISALLLSACVILGITCTCDSGNGRISLKPKSKPSV